MEKILLSADEAAELLALAGRCTSAGATPPRNRSASTLSGLVRMVVS
jgi:hypothetical protein